MIFGGKYALMQKGMIPAQKERIFMQKRFLVFGAHPDDPDIMFGGSALKLVKAGHIVKFVSVTDGGAGHHLMTEEALIPRRYQEAQNSAALLGLEEYQILDNPDGRLENTLQNREEITKIIREFRPDVVIVHRLCDYHPDHRTAAQLVLDSAFLLKVPLFCKGTPVPENLNPVFAHSFDNFQDPRPIRVDAWTDTTEVMETKFRSIDCHKSQFYEWLPWVNWGMNDFDATGWTWEQRLKHLEWGWGDRFRKQASLVNQPGVETAEVFELSPYGKNVSPEEFQALLDPK